MQNLKALLFITTLTLSALALSACAGRTDRIEGRQAAHTSAFESRQERFDARAQGRQDRRQIRSDHADARFNAGFDAW